LVAAAVKVVAMAEVAAVEGAAVVVAAETSSSILDVAPDVSINSSVAGTMVG
jgi:hypothetical protein